MSLQAMVVMSARSDLHRYRIHLSSATVLLDDPTDHTNKGPICVNSKPTSIDPSQGPLLLGLRVNFAKTSDKTVVRRIRFTIRLSSL